MKIQHLTAADAFASLKSRASGPDDAEAARRLAGFGKNQVEEIARESMILTFAREFVHFFAIILWIAAALAFFAEWNQPGQGMATLGFAIIGVIVINGVFSFWQAYRAEQALAVLKKLLPHSTRVLRSGNVRQIAAAELVPGDLILLEGGDILPADCRLVEAFGVRVNNATITGTQLGHLTNIQLQLALDAPEILFARVQAEQKMRIVAALKKKNEIVAVTGDGVNDAPALRKAHVGIAMGLSGTDVARESADVVLLDDNFASIVAVIEEGRAVFTNIRNFLTYILTSNVPEIIPYLAFMIFRIPRR